MTGTFNDVFYVVEQIVSSHGQKPNRFPAFGTLGLLDHSVKIHCCPELLKNPLLTRLFTVMNTQTEANLI